MESFITTETLVIELLLIASLVAIAVRRLRVPYTVALVIVGLLITLQPSSFQVEMTPELILALLVPPLIFEAAFHINLAQLRRGLPLILLLAIPGVILTTLLVGGAVSLVTPLALPLALVFGALMSATDPVAVVALFRAVGAPRRLALLVEGESLLNDGTAIVIYNLVLVIALTGAFSLGQSIVEFVKVALGGLGVGFLLGFLVSKLIARIDDYLIETTLTTVLAFGSYLVAERLHFSGVLAVVAAGLISGNIGPQGMSPTTRIVLFNFWEYLAFLANSFVFLLIGLQIDIPTLVSRWQSIAWAIAAVLVVRSIMVYAFGWLSNRFAERVPVNWLHIINWGGLRGAIALALALSLPAELGAAREEIRIMAFGVVLFTLVVQSTTMKPLMRLLNIVERDPVREQYELGRSRLFTYRAAARRLDEMHQEGFLSEQAWETLRPELLGHAQGYALAVRDLQARHPELTTAEISEARRELLRAQRSALMGLRSDGTASDDVFDALAAEIDLGLIDEETIAPVDETIAEAASTERGEE